MMMVKVSCMLVLVLALIPSSVVRAETKSFANECIKRYSENDGTWTGLYTYFYGDEGKICDNASAELTVFAHIRRSVELKFELLNQGKADEKLNVEYNFGDCMAKIQYNDSEHTQVSLATSGHEDEAMSYVVPFPTHFYLVPEGGELPGDENKSKDLSQGLYVKVNDTTYEHVKCSPFTDSNVDCIRKQCTIQFVEKVTPGDAIHYKLGIYEVGNVAVKEWKPTTTTTTTSTTTTTTTTATKGPSIDAEDSTTGKEEASNLMWIIIGASVLALIVLIIVVVVVVVVVRRRKKKQHEKHEEPKKLKQNEQQFEDEEDNLTQDKKIPLESKQKNPSLTHDYITSEMLKSIERPVVKPDEPKAP